MFQEKKPTILRKGIFYSFAHHPKKAMTTEGTLDTLLKKMEYYCSYQERCHQEVVSKMYDLNIKSNEMDAILVHLIEHNFLNEERFARSFARGKHRIKQWGKSRIVNELKARQISATNITFALTEINEEEYLDRFHTLAEKQWNSIQDRNIQKKKKKFFDFLYRKGWESHLIYDKMKELENE